MIVTANGTRQTLFCTNLFRPCRYDTQHLRVPPTSDDTRHCVCTFSEADVGFEVHLSMYRAGVPWTPTVPYLVTQVPIARYPMKAMCKQKKKKTYSRLITNPSRPLSQAILGDNGHCQDKKSPVLSMSLCYCSFAPDAAFGLPLLFTGALGGPSADLTIDSGDWNLLEYSTDCLASAKR